ncbi:MAG: Bifunctional homocysteine S-methyltransferase/5,10-methylenetetrahydrofolate reductase [Pseudomonadota bacterium]|jgi:5,10-methylenetetrahydrofolate reductase
MALELLREVLKGGKSRPLLCLEVNPPRGVDVGDVLARLEGQVGGIDFFNVTDCALAKMRLAAVPFAAILKSRFGIEPLVNFSCRDRNLIAIQADLLGGWALGIRSVIALTGDAVTIGDSPERKGVFEVNSIGLLGAIQTLNEGRDLVGNPLTGTPEYFPGVVVNPNARNRGAELKRLKRKLDAGARYALSQPVFDEVSSVEFFKEAQGVGIPILMGLMPLKSARSVAGLAKVPGVRVSEAIESLVKADPERDLADFSVHHCLHLAELNAPFVAGFHVVSGATPKLAIRLANELATFIKSRG